jgi:hypothetical protein
MAVGSPGRRSQLRLGAATAANVTYGDKGLLLSGRRSTLGILLGATYQTKITDELLPLALIKAQSDSCSSGDDIVRLVDVYNGTAPLAGLKLQ